jgi:L-lactate dehydrogenase complex protein LldF
MPTPEQALMSSAAWVMESPARWTGALRAARLGRLLGGRRGKITALPPPLSAWTGTRDAPLPPAQPFRAWWAKRERGRRREAQ